MLQHQQKSETGIFHFFRYSQSFSKMWIGLKRWNVTTAVSFGFWKTFIVGFESSRKVIYCKFESLLKLPWNCEGRVNMLIPGNYIIAIIYYMYYNLTEEVNMKIKGGESFNLNFLFFPFFSQRPWCFMSDFFFNFI